MGVISIVLIVAYVIMSINHLRLIGTMGAVREAVIAGSAMCSFILSVMLYTLFEDGIEGSRISHTVLVLLLLAVSLVFFGLLYCVAERQRERHTGSQP